MNNNFKQKLINKNMLPSEEFSTMSNREIINLIDFMNKDSDFLKSLVVSEGENEKYEIIESLLAWTEKISDPELLEKLVKFAFPVDDKLMNKILDKIDENIKIDDELMGELGEQADIIRFGDGKTNTWQIDSKSLEILGLKHKKELLEHDKKSSENKKGLSEHGKNWMS